MLTKVKSFGLNGLDGYLVDVEVDVSAGMPSYDIVGLGDTAIKESKFRVKSAIRNSLYQFPIDKVTINLAPADTKKEGSLYDLAIAVGILVCQGVLDKNKVKEFAYVGELSLDGSIKKVNGILPILITAKELGIKKVIVPKENAFEASYIENIEAYCCSNIIELVEYLQGLREIEKIEYKRFEDIKQINKGQDDFKYVKGQALAKRALEISASGGHNCIMVGPPGSGKSMLAKCLPSILPDLTFEEALEVTKIHSIAGVLDANVGIITNRPFRSPHHTTTTPALVGGGRTAKPGEISLSHNGVLFLDEFPEYPRTAIETLRQPLEDSKISISRVQQTIEYPANVMLIASMNPCPCGYYGQGPNKCKCTPSQIIKYRNKLSGPIMDRIDLHVEVDGVNYSDLTSREYEESSESIKARVEKARNIQLKRFANDKNFCNAKMNNEQIKKYCKLDEDGEDILKMAFEVYDLSARAYSRILKVARTIADLDNSENILVEHLTEALQYRNLDKKDGEDIC
ncbi:MAG: YifB family Mg chelatase-like AAA ATPase [Clostridia bacterium]|nr:YifB family Mg chelatase-like AAA ATPase [Clostridia bacterium]